MGDVAKYVLEPLTGLYGEYKSTNVDAALDMYEIVLAEYSNSALQAATAHICGDYLPSRDKPWPAPALIKRAVMAYLEKQPQKPVYAAFEHKNYAEKKSREDREKDSDRREWRKQIVERYGSMDAFLIKAHGRGGKASTWRQPKIDRTAFLNKEVQAANAAARAKRIIGERDE
jgi:hypothetical protein